jgi:hypothetical protein
MASAETGNRKIPGAARLVPFTLPGFLVMLVLKSPRRPSPCN